MFDQVIKVVWTLGTCHRYHVMKFSNIWT